MVYEHRQLQGQNEDECKKQKQKKIEDCAKLPLENKPLSLGAPYSLAQSHKQTLKWKQMLSK